MSTARKITPECQPQFPCWLWIPKIQPVAPGWLRYFAKVETCLTPHATHWHPDQPTAPEPVKEDTRLLDGPDERFATPPAPDWAEVKRAESIALEIAEWGFGNRPVATTVSAIAAIILRYHAAQRGGEAAMKQEGKQ